MHQKDKLYIHVKKPIFLWTYYEKQKKFFMYTGI